MTLKRLGVLFFFISCAVNGFARHMIGTQPELHKDCRIWSLPSAPMAHVASEAVSTNNNCQIDAQSCHNSQGVAQASQFESQSSANQTQARNVQKYFFSNQDFSIDELRRIMRTDYVHCEDGYAYGWDADSIQDKEKPAVLMNKRNFWYAIPVLGGVIVYAYNRNHKPQSHNIILSIAIGEPALIENPEGIERPIEQTIDQQQKPEENSPILASPAAGHITKNANFDYGKAVFGAVLVVAGLKLIETLFYSK
jgi:hypothetical protein